MRGLGKQPDLKPQRTQRQRPRTRRKPAPEIAELLDWGRRDDSRWPAMPASDSHPHTPFQPQTLNKSPRSSTPPRCAAPAPAWLSSPLSPQLPARRRASPILARWALPVQQECSADTSPRSRSGRSSPHRSVPAQTRNPPRHPETQLLVAGSRHIVSQARPLSPSTHPCAHSTPAGRPSAGPPPAQREFFRTARATPPADAPYRQSHPRDSFPLPQLRSPPARSAPRPRDAPHSPPPDPPTLGPSPHAQSAPPAPASP